MDKLEEQRREFLKAYLGQFYVPVEVEYRMDFAKKYPSPTPILATGKMPFLRKVGACFLLAWGTKDKTFLDSSKLVDMQFAERSERQDDPTMTAIEDIPATLLVVFHYAGAHTSTFTETVVCGCATGRAVRKRATLILSETPLPSVAEVFRDRGWGIESEKRTRREL